MRKTGQRLEQGQEEEHFKDEERDEPYTRKNTQKDREGTSKIGKRQ
jgi:hypothetical protein